MSENNAQNTPIRTGRGRGFVVFGLKVVVAAVLIGWLVRGGALDFSALRVMVEKPWLLALDIALVAVATVFGTLRWRLLLGLADVRVRFARLLQLQLTAFFFNVVIPGNVGGDVVKALYVARDEPRSKRTTILLIVFVERLLGLAGLVTTATVVMVLRGPVLWNDPLLRPLAITVALLGLAMVLGPALVVVVMRRAGDRIETWTGGTTKIGKLLGQLVAAIRLLSSGPANLAGALGISMLLHGMSMGFFTVLTRVITNQNVTFPAIATVFPLGLLTLVLPVSPSGLGVGHVAFERLFSAIGLTGGATVFNVFLIGQIAPYLVGVFPYLALRRSGTVPTAAEATADSPPS